MINMKKAIVLIAVIGLTACGQSSIKEMPQREETWELESFIVFTIDSCQYIGKSIGTQYGILTHKGNCNNPIHKHK